MQSIFRIIDLMINLPLVWDIRANQEEVLSSIYWDQCLCSVIIQQAHKASQVCSLLTMRKTIYTWSRPAIFHFSRTMHFLFLFLNVRSRTAIILLFYRVNSNLGRWRGLFTNHPEVNCGIQRNLMFFPPICSPDHSRGFSFNLESFPRPLFPSSIQILCFSKVIPSTCVLTSISFSLLILIILREYFFCKSFLFYNLASLPLFSGSFLCV